MSAYLLPQLQGLDLKCMCFFNDNHDREDGGQKIHYYFGEAKKLFTFMKGTRRFKRASSIDGCRTEFPNQKKKKKISCLSQELCSSLKSINLHTYQYT
jgi:hypothetical protein